MTAVTVGQDQVTVAVSGDQVTVSVAAGVSAAAVAGGLDAHVTETVDAHDASAVSYSNATSGLTATEVQAAIDEVDAALDALIAGAPGALDTLNELAAALDDDAAFATTVTNALADRYTKAQSDAAYAPIVDELWIGAADLILARGSPAGNTPSGSVMRMWALDASSTESVGAIVTLPAHWTTFDIEFWWTNLGAGSGDVVWRADWQQKGDTDDVTSGAAFPTATVTAPAQNIVKVSTIASGLSVTADKVLGLQALRSGSDGSDTLGNDAGVLGVMLRKAS